MEDPEFEALCRLLQDTNEQLAAQAGQLLVEHYGAALLLPVLQELADHNPALAARLHQQVEAQGLEEAWNRLAQEPDAEAATLLLSRWLAPLVPPARLVAQLDALAEPLRGTLPSEASAAGYRRDAEALRDWLAGAKRFRGDVAHYYAPENALLPYVLTQRQGQPLTLSLLYLLVARRLGAPLYPIGMPGHFIVRYGDERGIFLDPFNQGALMSQEDCQRWLAQQGIAFQPAFLAPISDHALIERLLRNLINAYAQQGKEKTVQALVRYLDIWTDFHRGS